MAHEFRMPDIGEGLTEAEIIKWFVEVGDAVEIDQILVEIETAKTVVEIPSPFEGTITSISVREGEVVEVGAVLFVVDGEGTENREQRAENGERTENREQRAGNGERAESREQRAEKEQRTKNKEQRSETAARQGAERTTPRAMPIVRKLAKERGIDLVAVIGTGPGGAITRTDLDVAPAEEAIPDITPLSRTRQTIADHMAASWATIPHVTVQAEVRAEALMEERSETPIEVQVARVVMPLLKAYPEFNSEYTSGGMAVKSSINMGFAVDTDAGLMVVVVMDADQLSVGELTVEFQRLAIAAMDRTITLDEITGQSFTVSNVGALGGGHGTPIIPLGTSAIVSIGRAKEQPVVEDGRVTVGLVAPLDLSYDHRLIDGALGQRFLSDLVTGLESADPA